MSPRTYEDELADYQRTSTSSGDDHELTLSTPTILGLFFGLVIVCGCFFGLGYAMGHRTVPAAPQVFDNSTAAAIGAAKPMAGSAAVPDTVATTGPTSAPTDSAAVASTTQTATVPLAAPAATLPVAPAVASNTSPAVVSVNAPARPTAPTPASQVVAGSVQGNFVVQVAAVSSQDVANILLSTLQKKGYAVTARHEPQDQLLHIQIGPFPDRKDAEAMRQRVLADGFNAIVK